MLRFHKYIKKFQPAVNYSSIKSSWSSTQSTEGQPKDAFLSPGFPQMSNHLSRAWELLARQHSEATEADLGSRGDHEQGLPQAQVEQKDSLDNRCGKLSGKPHSRGNNNFLFF
jgi:hypothetical protein